MMAHRQHSVTGRTCCICDRPCAILDCQCLENFQHNASEHGSLMKRLSAAFSMHVAAKDLHSFSLCCSCEHHLVVIEQANRIKECIKQVFIETREHRKFVNSQLFKHGKLHQPAIVRQKRLSSVIDSRSFDDSSPRVKKGRVVASSSSFPPAALPSPVPSTQRMPSSAKLPTSTAAFSFDESQLKKPQVEFALSFDSAFLPGASAMAAPQDKRIVNKPDVSNSLSDGANTMEFEEPAHSDKYQK